MAEASINKCSRGEKSHINNSEKIMALKENINQGFDSFTKVNKQTLDTVVIFYDKVSCSHKEEKLQLLKTLDETENEDVRKEVIRIFREIERKEEETMNAFYNFSKSEGEKTNKNIIGGLSLFAVIAFGLLNGDRKIR